MSVALIASVNRTLQLLDNLVEWIKIQLHSKKCVEIFNLNSVVNENIHQAMLSALLEHNKIINIEIKSALEQETTVSFNMPDCKNKLSFRTRLKI